MEWMLLPLKRYARFSGRARRKEYWMFFLFTMVVGAVLGILDSALGLDLNGNGGAYSRNGVLGSIFSLATLVPSIAVGVRRLHDTNRSGWWLVLPVVVLIVAVAVGIGIGTGGQGAGLGVGLGVAVVAAVASGIALLVFFCLDGTPGPNRFGPDPKDPAGMENLQDVFS